MTLATHLEKLEGHLARFRSGGILNLIDGKDAAGAGGVFETRSPVDESLIEIYVSPVATSKYFIDGATLAPGGDGVVRYVLVVKTSGGATAESGAARER